MMMLIVIALSVLPGLISDVSDTLRKRKGKRAIDYVFNFFY